MSAENVNTLVNTYVASANCQITGAGLGESMADHATPTLDAGMQMLQSLEASGDLDTPLSAESEVCLGALGSWLQYIILFVIVD